ncbi:MAG TPA: nitroreductase [Syntrophaceae bacterium]|nr:nitroreductase [Syntrophaceae bacterium]
MDVYDIVLKRRSVRRFKQKSIPMDTLKKLVNAARVAPSAANLQPLKYIIVKKKELVKEVFTTLKWAAYIAPKGNPPEGQRPVAYIVVLVDTKIGKKGYEIDVGTAVENIVLVAWNEGIGSCLIGSIDKQRLRNLLHIPGHLKIALVIALGLPDEYPVMEEMTDTIKYWRDESGVHHVPKRRLEDILYVDGF